MTEQIDHEEKAESDEKTNAAPPSQPVQCGLPRSRTGELGALCMPATPASDKTQEDA